MMVGHSHPLTLGTSREQALRYYVQPILETAELSSMQLIGRIFIEDRIVAHHIKSDPEAAAQYHHILVVASRMILHDYNKLGLDTRVHHWVIVNEVLADGRDNLARLARFERRRMELAGTDYGCGLFAFANANPALIGSPAGLFEEYDISSGHSTEIATLNWVADVPAEQLFVSAVTVGEIQAGIEITCERDEAKAEELKGIAGSGSSSASPLPRICCSISGCN